MEYKRADRVADQIQREVSRMLYEDLKDPGIGMVTISRVQVSPDLHYARIYYTVYGDEAQQRATHAGLTRAASFIRRQLGQCLRLRVTPEVSFQFDASLEHVQRISTLLHEIERQDAARAEGATEDAADERGGEGSSPEDSSSSSQPTGAVPESRS